MLITENNKTTEYKGSRIRLYKFEGRCDPMHDCAEEELTTIYIAAPNIKLANERLSWLIGSLSLYERFKLVDSFAYGENIFDIERAARTGKPSEREREAAHNEKS